MAPDGAAPSGGVSDRNSPYGSTRLSVEDSDSEKITYFTPRIGDVQLGISYTPNLKEDANSSIASVSIDYHHGIAVGANYLQSFDKTGVKLSAGYFRCRNPSGQFIPNPPGDPDGYSLAAIISYEGLTVGGSFATVHGLRADDGIEQTASVDGFGYEIGIAYEFGPYAASLYHFHGEGEAATTIAGKDKTDHYLISARRKIAAGFELLGSIFYVDYNGEMPGPSDDNHGWGFVTGIVMDF